MAFFTSSASFIVPATVADMQNYTSFLSANSRLFNSVQASFPENAGAPLTTYDPPNQEGTMSSAMRQILSLLLVWLLCVSTSLAARSRALTQAPASQKPTLQERVLEITPGSLVEVRLKNKEKLRGRLGETSADGFVLKHAKGQQIEERKIAFEDLKSIRIVGEGGKGPRVIWYVLGGVGITFAVLLAIGLAAAAGS